MLSCSEARDQKSSSRSRGSHRSGLGRSVGMGFPIVQLPSFCIPHLFPEFKESLAKVQAGNMPQEEMTQVFPG